MLVLLKRPLFTGNVRYRVSDNGTEVPDGTALPKDALVWDGRTWRDADEVDKIDFAALNQPTARPGIVGGRQTAKANVLEQRGATPREKALAERREELRLNAELAKEDVTNREAEIQVPLDERRKAEEAEHREAMARADAEFAAAKKAEETPKGRPEVKTPPKQEAKASEAPVETKSVSRSETRTTETSVPNVKTKL